MGGCFDFSFLFSLFSRFSSFCFFGLSCIGIRIPRSLAVPHAPRCLSICLLDQGLQRRGAVLLGVHIYARCQGKPTQVPRRSGRRLGRLLHPSSSSQSSIPLTARHHSSKWLAFFLVAILRFPGGSGRTAPGLRFEGPWRNVRPLLRTVQYSMCSCAAMCHIGSAICHLPSQCGGSILCSSGSSPNHPPTHPSTYILAGSPSFDAYHRLTAYVHQKCNVRPDQTPQHHPQRHVRRLLLLLAATKHDGEQKKPWPHHSERRGG